MIHVFDCPRCKAKVETEHEFGAQICPNCKGTFFTFQDYFEGTVASATAATTKQDPYAYFKREGN